MKRREALPEEQGNARPRRRLSSSPKRSCKVQGARQQGAARCSSVEDEGLMKVEVVVMAFLQTCLQSGIYNIKNIVSVKMKRLFIILLLMSLAALAGACFGTLTMLWLLKTNNMQVLLGQPAANERSLWNTLSLVGQKSTEMEHLSREVKRLTWEAHTVKEVMQQMKHAMPANSQRSGWALQSTGAAIDLESSPSISKWLCRVFSAQCALPYMDTFVQPDTSPGYCWPFQESRSEVLIRLPAEIEPMTITLQHSSKTATPLEAASSAPREFMVFGLDEEGRHSTLLGTFTYAVEREPAQTFYLQNETPQAFGALKLVIQSNWGKPGYICIYRVQVYGKIVKRATPC